MDDLVILPFITEFIFKPRDTGLHIPTDLLGLTPPPIMGRTEATNLAAAVNAPCTLIRERVALLGMLDHEARITTAPRRRKYSYPLGRPEQLLLMEILEHSALSPEGVACNYVFENKRRASLTK